MLIAMGLVLVQGLSAPAVLVNTADLAGLEAFIVVDARNEEAFTAGHVPGATHLDVASLSEDRDGVVGMLKPVKELIPLLAAAGLDPEKTIVVYGGMEDTGSVTGATRLFWALEYLGYPDVRFLDGGLAKWKGENRPLERGEGVVQPVGSEKLIRMKPMEQRYATRAEVVESRATSKGLLMDLRGAAYYRGDSKSDAVPRAGHITGAKSLPGTLFLDEPYLTFKSPEAIREQIAATAPDTATPVITYCNTGRVATLGYVAFRIAGFENVSVYDGSMSEWGLHADCPVSVGQEE